MRVVITLSILILFGACSKNKSETFDLIISNINLIDGTGNPIKNNTNVLIQGEKIVAIREDISQVKAKKTIEGKGKYLIPGLFDAHFHFLYDTQSNERSLNQLIHFGVTSILVPGGFLGSYENLKKLDSLESNERITSPHIYYTSLITTIQGAHPMKTYGASLYKDGLTVHIIKNKDHITHIVNEAKANGAIALKLMVEDGPLPPFVSRISSEYIESMALEGRKQDIPLFTHVNDMEEVKLSVNNGTKSLMHFIGVNIDWERDLETIDKINKDSISWVTTIMVGKAILYPLNKQWMKSEHWSVFGKDELEILQDSDGELANQSRMILKAFVGNENISMEELLLPALKDINRLNALGVNIVTGTDVGGKSYILPGLSVHEEMQLLQLGGMNPLDIIRSTSRNAAFMLGILDDYGTVESGKYADLVILENNPLVDISNTLSIVDVIKNGKIQVRIETNANKR